MALDVYVGGFARFYAREWENVAQAWARETGAHYQMIGPDGPPKPADWDEVAEAVGNWREAMNQGLGEHLPEPLTWDESRDAPYFTDRPTYDGYGALMVWAAHAELGTKPPATYDGEWYSDDAFQKCYKPEKGQKYRPIILGSLWLPGDFEFTFDCQDLVGEKVHICSNALMQESLRELNQATFQMSAKELAKARQGDYGENPSLEALAEFGLALFLRLAEKSVEHHLPMKMST